MGQSTQSNPETAELAAPASEGLAQLTRVLKTTGGSWGSSRSRDALGETLLQMLGWFSRLPTHPSDFALGAYTLLDAKHSLSLTDSNSSCGSLNVNCPP